MPVDMEVELTESKVEVILPTVLRKFGYRFHFYSNEGSEPPHIHITGKGGEMKVWIPEMVVEFSYRLSPAEQRKIMVLVRDNVNMLLEKWNELADKKE
jgi:hypothetical protein